MSELEEDLRATADSIATDADRLVEIEAQKAALEPSDPKVLELSIEAEAVVKSLVPQVTAERVLARENQS
ncbi:MAG: hypothetical protein QOF49_844 [Chloroflexota bacterium]|jgi:hypothetical protein|nr:hypothetical protein [Chloroflexota bacterium]